MTFEMTIYPYSWLDRDHLPSGSTYDVKNACFVCKSELDYIQTFKGDVRSGQTEYPAQLSVCTGCAMPHLQLLTHSVDFSEPVIISWN